ncbi:MAG TPA: DUF4142 domain-containing protein [Chryseosolibacter sp.]|nr:DUF4142 domain-containing protein [Chryseosolibacter sp.]
MKKLYNQIHVYAVVIMACTLLASCSQDLTHHEAINKNQRKIEDPERLDDARFLVEARSFNLLDMRLAELASENGYAASIVNLAKKDIETHEDLARDLNKLAAKEKIAIPDNMNEEHQSILFELSKAEREDFDQQYISALNRINDDITRRFTTMATQAKDADIRAFAARRLGTLREQESLLSEVEDELMDTY